MCPLVVLTILGLFSTPVHSAFDPCVSYRKISEPHRSTLFAPEGGDRLLCDRDLAPGWYKFANGDDMPTSCVNTFHCGTNVPIWLNGQLPSVQDGEVTRQACANYGFAFGGSTACCNMKLDIRVKNCGAFNVYYLLRTPGCSMAYCAGSKPACSIGTVNIANNTCTYLFPKMTKFPELSRPQVNVNKDVTFTCHVPYPSGEPNVAFEVTWTVDGHVLLDPATNKPITTVLTNDHRDAVLNANLLQGHLGKSLGCNVTSYYQNSPSIRSDILKSSGYWVGIRTSTSRITVDEKLPEQEIEIESTLPIPCHNVNPQACDIQVEMAASHDPNDVSTSGCTYTLKYDANTQTYKATIKVKATRDFLDDKDKTHQLAFRPIFNFNQPMWLGYQIRPLLVVTKDRKHGTCLGAADPHFKQLDYKGRMDVYEMGDLVMYKSKVRPFEVQIRTWSCGHYNPCICAVVAREGNDVVTIDMCQRRLNQIASPDFKIISQGPLDGTTVDRDPTGKNFFINFPSGARVHVSSVLARPKTEKDGYLNVDIQAPTDDIDETEGLCGTFNEIPSDDFIGPDGHQYDEHTKKAFMHSWIIKPGSSMFDNVPPHEQRYEHGSSHFCSCDNGTAACTKGGAKNPSKGVCNNKCVPVNGNQVHPRDLGYSDVFADRFVPDEVRQLRSAMKLPKRSASWPTPSGITEAAARQKCTSDIGGSMLAGRCGHMADPPMEHYIEACMEDMLYADGDMFNMAHMDSYDIACQNAVLRDPSNYQRGPHGELIPPADVTSHVCPNQCSRKGTCVQGVCHCNHGYTSADCSIDTSVAPVIDHIRGDGLCDIRTRPCRTANIIAENLMDTPTLTCKYQPLQVVNGTTQHSGSPVTSKGTFRSFLEIECPLPATPVHSNEATAAGFIISVSRDGNHFSHEQMLLIYDGKCKQCTSDGHCTMKANTCEIDLMCHASGEENPDHQICKPEVSTTQWTSDQAIMNGNQYTSSPTGCACTFDQTRFDCACCLQGGCQCGEVRADLCMKCDQLDQCAN